jgi:hypothetical protein
MDGGWWMVDGPLKVASCRLKVAAWEAEALHDKKTNIEHPTSNIQHRTEEKGRGEAERKGKSPPRKFKVLQEFQKIIYRGTPEIC